MQHTYETFYKWIETIIEQIPEARNEETIQKLCRSMLYHLDPHDVDLTQFAFSNGFTGYDSVAKQIAKQMMEGRN